jgi:hypothetical protein
VIAQASLLWTSALTQELPCVATTWTLVSDYLGPLVIVHLWTSALTQELPCVATTLDL